MIFMYHIPLLYVMQLILSKQTQLPIFVLEIQKNQTGKTFVELRYTKLWFFLLFVWVWNIICDIEGGT